MKVIDLLNKIAKGEKIPERIKFRGNIYYYDTDIDYKDDDGVFLFSNSCCINEEELNQIIEIIGEKKIPEKIELKEIAENNANGIPNEKLIKDIEEWNKQEKCCTADNRTDLEIEQEKTIQKLIEKNKKLEIENNLMKELLSRPVSYTYGIR